MTSTTLAAVGGLHTQTEIHSEPERHTLAHPATAPIRPAVNVSEVKLLLAPLVTFLAANGCRVVPEATVVEPDGRMPENHRYFIYDLEAYFLSPTDSNHGALLFTLISANHGPGRALRAPLKISVSTAFGGLDSYLTGCARLVIAVPLTADFGSCKDQVNALLRYLLRDAIWRGPHILAANAFLQVHRPDGLELPVSFDGLDALYRDES